CISLRADDRLRVRSDRRVRPLHLSRRPLSPGRRPRSAAKPQRALGRRSARLDQGGRATKSRRPPRRRTRAEFNQQGEIAWMKFRKGWFGVVSVAVALVATACDGSTGTSNNPADQTGTLTVWLMNGSAPTQVIDSVNADFKAKYPKVEVKVEIQQWG